MIHVHVFASYQVSIIICFVFVGMVTLQNQKRRAFHFSPSVDADSKSNTTPKSNTNSQTSDQTQKVRSTNNTNVTPSATKDYDNAATSGRLALRSHDIVAEPTGSSRRPLNDLLSGNFDNQVLDLTKKVQVAYAAKRQESKTVSFNFDIWILDILCLGLLCKLSLMSISHIPTMQFWIEIPRDAQY